MLPKLIVMAKDFNFEFIRNKIYEVKTAIMYNSSNELVKIPNDIVSVLKVDDEGQLWFLSRHPGMKVSECVQSFPVRLHLFRKGVSFHMEISGKATIVNKAYYVLNGDFGNNQYLKSVLIKMSMLNVEYTEPEAKPAPGKIGSILKESYNWLLRNAALPKHNTSVLTKLHRTQR